METVAREPDTGFRYWSFISYSHRDEAWGRWLHRALETYRIPSRLVGMPIDAGVVPARLTPIFRDRDELPTAADLDLSIVQALQQSYCMIVICSPASAASRWVDEEVLAFQRMGRGHRIYCLIVEGRDDAARTPCFPAALQSGTGDAFAEPLAADARHGHDGRFHAKLKLIGGILGVGFDKLVQREQHRKHRRTFAVACAAGIALAVLSIFSVVAYTSRREAEAQRGHAEKLVEFMLGDLRKKLEPEGRLSTLDAVGKEALAYYASQQPGALDADALARRARSLHLIGEVQDQRGQIDEALAVFKQAAASTSELLTREPNDAQRIFDHAQSVYWVGYIAWQRGNVVEAEQGFNSYQQLSARLLAIDPARIEWQAESEYAEGNLGSLLFEQGRIPEARIAFTKSLELASKIAKAAPRDMKRQWELAQSHAFVSDALSALGSLVEATDQRRTEVTIYEEILEADPEDIDARIALIVGERTLAELALLHGNVQDAVAHLLRATGISSKLLLEDIDNTKTLNPAVIAYADLADALDRKGDTRGALAAVQRAHELASRLLGIDPSVVAWQRAMARANILEARFAMSRGETLDALRIVQLVNHKLEKADTPSRDSASVQLLRARALLLSAEINERLGNLDAMHRNCTDVLALQNQRAPFVDPRMMLVQAAVLMKAGRRGEADEMNSRLRALGYAVPIARAAAPDDTADLSLKRTMDNAENVQ